MLEAFLWDEFAKAALAACVARIDLILPEEHAANIADEMLKQRLKRFPVEEKEVRKCTG